MPPARIGQTLISDEDPADAKLARRVLSVVRTWTPALETQQARLARDRLDAVRGDIPVAATWLLAHAPAKAAQLVVSGETYWVAGGMTGLAAAWANALLDRYAGPSHRRARLLATLVRLGGVRRDIETRALAEEALALGRRFGIPAVQIEALYELADPDGVHGIRLEAAAAALEGVKDLGPTTIREQAIALDLEAALARRTKGAAAEAAVLARGLARARSSGMLRRMVHLGGNLAEVELGAGRTAIAGSIAAEAVLDAREIGDGRNEVRALGILAVVHALLRDRSRAARALRRGAILASSSDLAIAVDDVVRAGSWVAALMGRPADAAWLVGPAAPAPTIPAIRRGLADARRRLGEAGWLDASRAGASATVSSRLARVEGLADWLEAAPPHAPRTALGLTQREIEVLTLLGDGLSDAEIGDRLFISAKTVSVHLANARVKTGKRRRVELARMAREALSVAA